MVRTISLSEISVGVKNAINSPIVNKILTNPVLLSMLVVFVIILILLSFSIIDNKNNNLFKGMVFSIIITSGIMFYHNYFIKQYYTKQGKQEMTDYFSGMAENTKSNIYGASRPAVYVEKNGGDDLSNLDIEEFFK